MEAPTSVDSAQISNGLPSPGSVMSPSFQGKLKPAQQQHQHGQSGSTVLSAPAVQSPRLSAVPAPDNNGSGSTPNINPDFLCTICQHIIKEAFMTVCGHSFCYACITKHLEIKNDCPSCGRVVSRSQLFPNFSLNKILEAQVQQSDSTTPTIDGQVSSTSMYDMVVRGAPPKDISAGQLRNMIAMLVEQKKRVESQEKELQSEIISEFLMTTKKQKEQAMMKLKQEIDFLTSDLRKVEATRQSHGSTVALGTGGGSSGDLSSAAVVGAGPGHKRGRDSTGGSSSDLSVRQSSSNPVTETKKRRVKEHLTDLQSAYFDVRRRAPMSGAGTGFDDPLQTFSESLSKFTRFTKLDVVAVLKYGDLFNASNIVSCIDFDRDDEFFATGGVTKKIKIFEYNNVVSNRVDVHYPVKEMSCSSKVSCLSWNSYIKSQLASSDYEGIVSVWDANTCTATRQYEEHEKRVWCVDFSKIDPTRLASGSDDTKVKIWTTTQATSALTIDSKANICCVKFNPSDAYHVAFGSADHNIHYYDLRQPLKPLRVYTGHKKAVSYVKFMNGSEFVTASTDSTLKLWNTETSQTQRTFQGHVNEKNFVGLAANADYIACGSENNSVYTYCKSLSRPIMSHNFKALNPATGEENDDDASQFVSSVCWKRKSNVLVCANSQGTIKVLELK
eukprot:TRINITY_DN3938_c0_g1_i1.p1 TRINITY_DN3938_c0_g1~~TRINITY_DN3938_c0_g1_i1.p1  ORF type:complete len:671 (+),score=175.73 TRINITY_DN3938_c0_g1_i1:436-2448(+)